MNFQKINQVYTEILKNKKIIKVLKEREKASKSSKKNLKTNLNMKKLSVTDQIPKISTQSRQLTLIPLCIGCTFIVHNGKKFLKVFVSKNIIGHKLGEFSQTRSRYYFKKGLKNKKRK